jgi:hypothetical protein
VIVIAKSIAHIDSLVGYVFKAEKDAYILDSLGLDTESKQTILNDFQSWQSPRLSKQYLSIVVSPEEGRLDDDKLNEVILDVLQELKLDNHMFLAVVHDNTEHKHVHLLVNRTSFDRANFNDSYVGLKAMEVSKLVADRHRLGAAYDKRGERKERKSSKNSAYHSEKDKAIEAVRTMVKDIMYKPSTLDVDDIFDHLKDSGVNIQIERHKNGTLGVSLEYNGQKMKASEVSRFITLSPDGDSYKANKLLEPILKQNYERLHKKRTDKDIMRDISEHPERANELLQELQAYTNEMRTAVSQAFQREELDGDFSHLYQKKKRRRFGQNVLNW